MTVITLTSRQAPFGEALEGFFWPTRGDPGIPRKPPPSHPTPESAISKMLSASGETVVAFPAARW